MHRSLSTVLAAAAASVLILGTASSAIAEQEPPTPTPDSVVVVFDASTSPEQRATARRAADAEHAESLGDPLFQRVDPAAGESAAETAEVLRAQPGVLAAVPDVYFSMQSLTDDPLLPELWGLVNTGQSVNGTSGTGDADIDADLAWDRTVGAPGTVVAVLDSGYDFSHPDLASVVWTNPGEVPGNGVDDDGNGFIDDVHGWDALDGDSDPSDPGYVLDPNAGRVLADDSHGVHVAGIVGARGDEGIGMTGVAQDARLMPVRVCAAVQSYYCSLSAMVAGINYAGSNGARVVNMSITGLFSPETAPAMQPLALAFGANPDVLFVTAAGNDAVDADSTLTGARKPYPCAIDPSRPDDVIGYVPPPGAVDNVLCVGATDQNDAPAWFSNHGAESVDLAAPGVSTLSATQLTSAVYTPTTPEDFAEWSTSGGFRVWTTGGDVPSSSLVSDALPAMGPPTHTPGTTRSTQSPDILIPAGIAQCIATLKLSFYRPGPGDTAEWSILLDGAVASTSIVDPTSPGPPPLAATLAIPSDGAAHTIALRVAFTRMSDDPAKPLVLVVFARPDVLCHQPTYVFMHGTSMATPHVAGTAALLYSLAPAATVAEVKAALLAGVDVTPSLAGMNATGGRLNAWAALERLVPLDTRLTAQPPATIKNKNKSSSTFAFDSAGTGPAGFECSLDGAAFTACTSPVTYPVLAVGPHTFAVRASLPGGADATPAHATWVVGNTPKGGKGQSPKAP